MKEQLIKKVLGEIAPEKVCVLSGHTLIKASQLRGFFVINVAQPDAGVTSRF